MKHVIINYILIAPGYTRILYENLGRNFPVLEIVHKYAYNLYLSLSFKRKSCKICSTPIFTPLGCLWYLYQMVTQNMLRTHEGKLVFLRKNIRFLTALILSNALNRSNNRDAP